MLPTSDRRFTARQYRVERSCRHLFACDAVTRRLLSPRFQVNLDPCARAPMNRSIIYAALTATVVTLVASAIPSEQSERRQPGERRGERFNKVGNAGDESAEAQVKSEQFAQART